MIILTTETYLIAEKIFIKALKPLDTFMNESEFLSVCADKRLLDGSFFPIPYALPVERDIYENTQIGETVPLSYKNEYVGSILITDRFFVEPKTYVENIFLTNDTSHPGVRNHLAQSGYFLGGEITLNKNQKYYLRYGERTPEEILKPSYQSNEKIVGFATRNVPHQGHIHILKEALTWADKILVLATIGSHHTDTYAPYAIAESFNFIAKKHNFQDRLIFDYISMPPTLSGPSEAMLQAIIRRNYGATHFIIGRNHSGIGAFYETYQAQDIALSYQDEIGIRIVKQKGPYFCKTCNKIVTSNTCSHSNNIESKIEISSSDLKRSQQLGKSGDSRIFDIELWEHLTSSDLKIFLE